MQNDEYKNKHSQSKKVSHSFNLQNLLKKINISDE